jgi:hypothetical protein
VAATDMAGAAESRSPAEGDSSAASERRRRPAGEPWVLPRC